MVMLAVFLFSVLLAPSVSAQQENAQAAISSAKDTLKNCYDAVLQAESAGANIDSLVAALNDAASSFSTAELAYVTGDYDTAYTAASQCQNKLDGFIAQAEALKEGAETADNQNFWFTIIFSVFSLAVLGGGAAVWVVLNKREWRKIHGS